MHSLIVGDVLGNSGAVLEQSSGGLILTRESDLKSRPRIGN